MTTLLTGATGFVGSAVTRALLAAGHDVRVLVRVRSNRCNLDGLNVEIVTGDLNDCASLERSLLGCRALFHVAADYRLWVRDASSMYATNVDGTRSLMRAALDAGVERIVYTSSVATLGSFADGTEADETTPVSEADMIGPYKHSKYLAESVVRELIRKDGLPAVIVHPSTPIGARDIKPTPTGRLIAEAAAGRVPAYVDTGLNLVGVDDVARGHLLAYERGEVGRGYILGGENLSLKEILCRVAEIAGRRPPRVRLPRAPLLPLAYLAELWARRPGAHGEPLMTVDGVRLSGKKMYFSSRRANRELGYAPNPVAQSLRDAIEWFGHRHA